MRLAGIVIMGLSVIWPIEAPPLSEGAIATLPAVRVSIPEQEEVTRPPEFDDSYANGVCVGLIPLLDYYSPGWDSQRMARIAYRESRCQPAAINPSSGTAGLFQISSVNYRYLREQMGQAINQKLLLDPILNVRAARELFEYDDYGPWKL